MRESLIVLLEVVLIASLAVGAALTVGSFLPAASSVGVGLVVWSIGCLAITVAAQIPQGDR